MQIEYVYCIRAAYIHHKDIYCKGSFVSKAKCCLLITKTLTLKEKCIVVAWEMFNQYWLLTGGALFIRSFLHISLLVGIKYVPV